MTGGPPSDSGAGVRSLWQFFGGPGRLPYRLFDAMRRRLNRRLVRFLTIHAVPPNGGRVLEAGSGPAYASSLFRKKVNLAVALDLDLAALQEARRRDPAVAAVKGDLFNLPFKNGSFDLVWNSSTVEHLDHPVSAVKEMARAAGSGKSVFVGVPYRWGPLGIQPLFRRTRAGIWLGTVFSAVELSRTLQDAGLKPGSSLRYFFRFFVGIVARKP